MRRSCSDLLTGLAMLAGASCAADVERPEVLAEIDGPDAFSASDGGQLLGADPWWTTFGAPSLDSALEAVMAGSFELEQAWLRLEQADAAARAAGAPRLPALGLGASAQRLEINQSGGSGTQIPLRVGETYSIGPTLSYEIDLFGRIGAAADSARFAATATESDARATALALSGRATDAWLIAVENAALMRLVARQIETGEQLVSLTRSRFTGGGGSALDVLQQERLLEATRAELPRFAGARERAAHQLSVLAGERPKTSLVDFPEALPELPPLPDLDVPSALLSHRPDLTAAYQRVRQFDRDVAVAIADRYPRLSLDARYSFDANELSAIFDRTISSIVGSLDLPFFDGGARRAEVSRQRARLDEAIAGLSQAFLVAIQEVEDALSLEARGVERVRALERQRAISVQEVDQARRRYVGGIDSYLQVLSAVQNQQALDRLIVSERAAVLRARAQLLRAIGGTWPQTLEPR